MGDTATAETITAGTNAIGLSIAGDGTANAETITAGTGTGGGLLITGGTGSGIPLQVTAAAGIGNAATITGNAAASAAVITGSGTNLAPALTLIGNPPSAPTDLLLTINGFTGVVTQGTTATGNVIVNGCQTGPLNIVLLTQPH